jgi:hypothetical protein
MSFVRYAFVGFWLGMFVFFSAAHAANSCSNIDSFSSYDRPPLREKFGIGGVGSFRIAGEADENKQPNFNLAFVDCESEADDTGRAGGLSCKLTQAVTWANDAKPDGDRPNCSLDLEVESYSMKELSKGVLTGIEEGTGCFNTMLTIDRNAKRIYLSFTRTKYADNYDKISSSTCNAQPRTQVLMNCTSWARNRNPKAGPGRYCDFGGVGE